MATQSVWHSRPVFVSSTFRDMQAERDHLAHLVFPELEERLKERFHHLEPIDLRWGVETVTAADQESKELLVLKVCLGEIERSRPFLIALLGDRYGWVPPETRMRAAAQEAGYHGTLAGKSVTALEIEFGVLASADQRRRSRFYFREELPYAEMDAETAALYSDAHSPDAEVRARHDKLEALKGEITETMRRRGMPERVRAYAATWDADQKRVTGLEAWGAQVLDDLWADLEEETRAFVGAASASWQEVERRALGEFVELACRDFQGREAVLSKLKAHALSPASPQAPWGVCVTGTSGSGKSALLAQLTRGLESDALVLAHAAGVSPRSTQVEDLLRRFIFELASALGTLDPAEELTAREDLERTFAQLLARAARERRVVVVIDAMNQFERTPSAMHLTWLPKPWPENARLIATAIPGIESEALLGRPGVEGLALPVLSAPEADAIVASTGRRYHKRVHPDVTAALLAKRRPDGAPSAGNPLWLTLALEELLLLDADDFARASRTYAGTEEEKLHALLVDTAGQLPTTVETLYGQLLARNEEVHGAVWASAFARLIAATRSGLRESDLAMLLPQETGEQWEPLRLAALRRSFRAHLARRGALVQWDFFHVQMREAVRRRYLGDPAEERRVHTVLADHLESLPREDALRQTELMVHVIGADDRPRAARHYGDATLSEAEKTGATRALATHIVAGQGGEPNAGLAWVTSLLDLEGIEAPTRRLLCNRFNFDLRNALVNETRLGTRLTLLQATRSTLERLAASDPTNAGWQHDLSLSHIMIGDVLLQQGDAGAALEAYRQSHGTLEHLAASDPTNAIWQHDLCVNNGKIGDVLLAQGDAAAALAAYRKTHAIFERLAASDRTNAIWQHDLCVNNGKIGDVLLAQGDAAAALDAYRAGLAISESLAASDPTIAFWQRDLSVSLINIGDVLLAQGDAAAALDAYRESLAISECLAASDPTNADWQRDLSVSLINIGDVLLAQGDTAAALDSYRTSLAIAERLAASDPTNADWQRDLFMGQSKVADILRAHGDIPAALEAYRRVLTTNERVAASDPTNAGLQRDLSVSLIRIGDVLLTQGDTAAASDAYRKGLAVTERLAASDPTNAVWQRDISVWRSKIGDVLRQQGDADAALDAYRKSHAIRERLAVSDPTNTDRQRDLAVSHEKVGDVLRAQGDAAAALDAYRMGLAISERLAAADPTNAVPQRDRSISHEKIGNVLLAQGDRQAALDEYRKTLAIRERLAASDPTNAIWQHDLFLSHSKTGDVLLAQGAAAAALDAYRKSLVIAERLAASDPTSSGWQRELSISHNKIGDVLLAKGDGGAALGVYRRSLTIIERLVVSDPTNTDWQYDLGVSNERAGTALQDQGDLVGALAAFKRGEQIMSRLAALDPTNAVWQRELAVSYHKLAQASPRAGDRSRAIEHLLRCRDVLRHMHRSGMHLDPAAAQLLEGLERLP